MASWIASRAHRKSCTAAVDGGRGAVRVHQNALWERSDRRCRRTLHRRVSRRERARRARRVGALPGRCQRGRPRWWACRRQRVRDRTVTRVYRGAATPLNIAVAHERRSAWQGGDAARVNVHFPGLREARISASGAIRVHHSGNHAAHVTARAFSLRGNFPFVFADRGHSDDATKPGE